MLSYKQIIEKKKLLEEECELIKACVNSYYRELQDGLDKKMIEVQKNCLHTDSSTTIDGPITTVKCNNCGWGYSTGYAIYGVLTSGKQESFKHTQQIRNVLSEIRDSHE